jgi:tetratricopeptide (TPR) repeat protein
MTQQAQSAEEKARLKKQWTELAVKQAQEGLWGEAVDTNKSILGLFPFEPDAFNRLGKAYSELGRYAEARQAYSQTLKYNPKNTIAKKNLDRLALIQEESVKVHNVGADRIDPHQFIEESGKTGMTELITQAIPSVLAKVGVGDRVQLMVQGHSLFVSSAAGDILGRIEPRLAGRLTKFISQGNRYTAAIFFMEGNVVRLIIREEYQHPSLFGQVSFPSQGSGDNFRAYIKDSMLRQDRDDDDDLGNDDEYYDGGDETDDLNEIDFEGSPEPEE